MPSVSIYSIYLNNISPEVVNYQKQVVDLLLPEKWEFEQVLHQPKAGEGFFHATALEECIKKNKSDIIVFLDIDCIPLNQKALTSLVDKAFQGFLTGAVQRANHLQNAAHLYVGPFCMAFSFAQYKKLGCPSLKESDRGDCGEELTYMWEEKGPGIQLLWPTHVYRPAWALRESISFGYGTTYEKSFYHAFAIRQAFMQGQFVNKCKEVIAATPKKVTPAEPKVEPKKITPKEVKEPIESKKEIQASKESKTREDKKQVSAVKEVSTIQERLIK